MSKIYIDVDSSKSGFDVYKAFDSKKPGQQVIRDKNTGKVLKVGTVTEANKTDQSFKYMVDVNRQLEKVHEKGLLRHAAKFEGTLDDLPQFDFEQAQIQVANAKSMFEQLPSNIRKQFDNKPGDFLKFVNNPANIDTLKEWGALKWNDGFAADGSPTTAPTDAQLQARDTAQSAAQAAADPNPPA
jgi:hypothetical protein